MLIRRWAMLAIVSQLCMHAARADDAASVSPQEEAAKRSTNPFFDTNSLQLQPAYTDQHAGGYSLQLLLRLLLAYKGLFIPGLKLGRLYSVARLEMYGEILKNPGSADVVGLQNWNGLLLGVMPFAWGAQLVLGAYSILPTATDPALDTQEFQLGPAAGAMVTHVARLQIGALVEFFFSVAGAKPGLATAQLQPFIIYHLPKAFFLKSDGIMKFNLKTSPSATVPVNLHLGHAFNSHLVLSAIVAGVTTGSGVGNVTVQLNLNYLGW
jgi:hypothetical protein